MMIDQRFCGELVLEVGEWGLNETKLTFNKDFMAHKGISVGMKVYSKYLKKGVRKEHKGLC